MNFEEARTNMITQQLRACEVLDETVLEVIGHTPRDFFVPDVYKNLAYADMNIPLDHDQIMLTPKEEGYILQALHLQFSEKILEIGTGSGYMTALLAKLGQHVTSVDIFSDFCTAAEQKLKALNITNVNLFVGDAAQGWNQQKYDVIVITGSLPYLPKQFQQNLRANGRLFAILGEAPVMEATVMTLNENDNWLEEKLFETVIPALINAPVEENFVF